MKDITCLHGSHHEDRLNKNAHNHTNFGQPSVTPFKKSPNLVRLYPTVTWQTMSRRGPNPSEDPDSFKKPVCLPATFHFTRELPSLRILGHVWQPPIIGDYSPIFPKDLKIPHLVTENLQGFEPV